MKRKIEPGDLFEIEKEHHSDYIFADETETLNPGDLVLVLEVNPPFYGMSVKCVANGRIIYLDRDELWWIAKLVN